MKNPGFLSSGSADSVEDLLPWYVNGTLSSEDHARVNQALAEDSELSLEVTFLSEVAGAMRATHLRYDEIAGRAELIRRARTRGGLVERFRRAWPSGFANILTLVEPKFAVALLVIVIQGAVLGQLMLNEGRTKFSEVRAWPSAVATTAATVYRITFRPDASEQDIRTLLVSAGARIIGGPTQLGDYYLVLSGSEESAKATLLQSSELVDGFAKLSGLPPEVSGAH